jgi:hypothetical protein
VSDRPQSYEPLDDALRALAPFGPDLRNGLTNHAPMVVEALCALGRGDAAEAWIAGYRALLLPEPPQTEPIAASQWRAALGREARGPDWTALLEAEVAEHPWREVLARWVARLAPGICAAATHGVIRVAHAARALAERETPPRLRELARALGYWAATYQVLPTAERGPAGGLRAAEAIRRVEPMPAERRRFAGTIVSSLEALEAHPAFAPVIDLFDVDGDPDAAVSDLSEAFARAYLANATDWLGTIVFTHGVTSAAALRHLLPHLDREAARAALRYGWQAGAALYAAFGVAPAREGEIEAPRTGRDALVERALASGDEHAIKLTEACLGEHARNPSAAYLAVADHAIGMLTRG